jgi:PAS domain S-box-containing protein
MIRILMVEDSAADAELISRVLRDAKLDFTVTRTATEAAFRQELLVQVPDVILADYDVPGFGGMDALDIANDLAPETPFIFVSGAISEDRAVAVLRKGAVDYILKDRPQRLPSAIERAIAERRERQTRRRMQESLRTTEQRFHLAVQATRDVIWDLDLDTKRVWVNDAMRSEWGHDVGNEVTQAWFYEHVHPDDREHTRRQIRAMLEGGENRAVMRYRFRRSSNDYGHVFDRGMVVRGSDGKPSRVIGAMQDVTEQQLAITALAEAQHIAKLGSWSYKTRGDRVVWSEETYRIFGVEPETKMTYESYLALIHPDDRSFVEERVSAAPRNGHIEFEHRVARPDGSVRWVLCRLAVTDENDGSLFGTVQDLTEWKRLHEQIEQANRIATLGRVVATIGHEFNNVLMGMQPFAELIRRMSTEPKITAAAAQILNGVTRARAMTSDILRMTQIPQPKLQTVDLAPWLETIAPEIEVLAGSRVRVEIEVPAPGTAMVRCDPTQLQQVITNLATNARDAMPQGGTLTIRTVAGDQDRVCIDVADTGAGIPADALPRIFEPLFTTKASGTGIGLSVVQQVITRAGGSITVDSVVGSGTVFHIELLKAEPVTPHAA